KDPVARIPSTIPTWPGAWELQDTDTPPSSEMYIVHSSPAVPGMLTNPCGSVPHQIFMLSQYPPEHAIAVAAVVSFPQVAPAGCSSETHCVQPMSAEETVSILSGPSSPTPPQAATTTVLKA